MSTTSKIAGEKSTQGEGRLAGAGVGFALNAGVLDQLQDVVFTANLKGEITSCNKGVSRYGYAATEVLGKNLGSLFELGGSETGECRAMAAVLEEGRYEVECRLHGKADKAGSEVHLCLTVLRDGRSEPAGMVGISIDISERRQAGRSGAGSAGSTVRTAMPMAKRVVEGTEFLIASPTMHKFMGMVDRVAGHTETVLVVGETGTGKELVARTIHESSSRRKSALVDINCAALPEHLVESELFGYEKGAFSGADSSKPGLFELADKSTIFLDEIGELQPQVQVKLLRVLDGAPYYRLGGHRKITVDVRVVAATNQDLEAAVKDGRFRKDLYHRLSQFQLRVPPLRERPEDITALARHFLALKAPDKNFSTDALSALQGYDWPGNIRELRNLVAKLAMTAERTISGAALAAELHTGQGTRERGELHKVLPDGNLENMEEQMIIRALEQTGGHRAQAAEQLGISRRTLTRKLREYGIETRGSGGAAALGRISHEQQKFFRGRVNMAVTLRNAKGKELQVQAVNLSTGGMGLDAVSDPGGFSGLVDVNFRLPESETEIVAKGRLAWADVGGRAGLRFVVIEPALFEELQRWTNQKMQDEGWELPT
jgi:PAS domain S-box-containing protein